MSWESSVGVIGVGVMLTYLVTAFFLNEEEHGIIKFFSLLMSFFIGVVLVHFSIQLGDVNSYAGNALRILFVTVSTGSFILTFYFVVYFFRGLLNSLGAKRKLRKGDTS